MEIDRGDGKHGSEEQQDRSDMGRWMIHTLIPLESVLMATLVVVSKE